MIFKIANEIVKHYRVASPNNGRQLVIPDIHGCFDTFKTLVESLALTKGDQLFLLGDYINRGPNNPAVLEYIFALIRLGYQVYPLRGNHEQMALDSYYRRKNTKGEEGFRIGLKKPKGLVDDKGLLFPKYAAFFESLPYYYELEDYYLVHAGFNFEVASPFVDYQSMIWLHTFEPELSHTHGKRVVRGHVSQTLEDIQQAIATKAKVVHLDGGCYKRREKGKGFLCCFDLTNNQLLYQANIEAYEEGRRK